jgi:quinol monooxygenase YgiN
MIVLNVTYRCKPDMRDAFLERIMAEGIDEACRGEKGNLKYDYYYPADDGDELLLVEKWQDAAALEAHGETPHFARLGAIKPEYVTETVVERFER